MYGGPEGRAMCYVLCDDFLCVMRDVLCAMGRFPMRYATISYASYAMCYTLCDVSMGACRVTKQKHLTGAQGTGFKGCKEFTSVV